jgi:hypothetical protein
MKKGAGQTHDGHPFLVVFRFGVQFHIFAEMLPASAVVAVSLMHQAAFAYGGQYWIRTSDLSDVNRTL